MDRDEAVLSFLALLVPAIRQGFEFFQLLVLP
jgi:hypothetical protein